MIILSGICTSIIMTGATSGIIHNAEHPSPRQWEITSPDFLPLPLHQQSVLQDTACACTQHKMLQDWDQNIHHLPVCLWKAFLQQRSPIIALCNFKSRTRSSARMVPWPLNCLTSRDHEGSKLRVNMPCCGSLSRGEAMQSLLPLPCY